MVTTIESRNSLRFDVQPITADNKYDILARVEPFHEQLRLAARRKWAELLANVQEGSEAVFGVERRQDAGVVLQRHKKINIGGLDLTVTMRLIRVVSPAFQQQDLAAEFTRETVDRVQPVAFTGRTPNPYIFLSDERSRVIQENAPLHRLFTPAEKVLLTAVLDPKSLAETNLRNGLCKGVYPSGESRLFVLNRKNPDAVRIYDRMTKPEPEGLGADLEGGDGIRYLSIVDKFRMDRLSERIAV